MFSEDQELINAFQHWFGVAIDSTQDVLTQMHLDQHPSVVTMYNITQECYKQAGTKTITLYRGCTETYGDEKPLCSWTSDEELAESYLTSDVQRDGTINEVVSKEFPVERILFDMGFVEEYFEAIDDVIGMMPCDEVIVINF